MSFKIQFNLESDPNNPKEALAELDERLTAVALRAGVTIQQTCGGTPSCADCKIKVLEGVDSGFDSPQSAEIRLLGNIYFITHERLSCQALVKGDATVFVPKIRRRAEKVFVPSRHRNKSSEVLAQNVKKRSDTQHGQKKEDRKKNNKGR
jgi:2Fe-2S ferredoxin